MFTIRFVKSSDYNTRCWWWAEEGHLSWLWRTIRRNYTEEMTSKFGSGEWREVRKGKGVVGVGGSRCGGSRRHRALAERTVCTKAGWGESMAPWETGMGSECLVYRIQDAENRTQGRKVRRNLNKTLSPQGKKRTKSFLREGSKILYISFFMEMGFLNELL